MPKRRKRVTKKKAPRYMYEDRDVGCYIDGTMGKDHALRRMAVLLEDLVVDAGSESAANLLKEYESEEGIDPDFEDEWLGEATEALQDVTDSGLVWEWEAGDLCLRESEDE